MDGLQLSSHLTTTDIMSALQAAHTAADEYYTVRHALAWNTDFVIEAIAADSILFHECGYDFARMCRHKQSKLAHNRLSVECINSILGLREQRYILQSRSSQCGTVEGQIY